MDLVDAPNVVRKWEFLADHCEAEGLHRAADIARRIDDLVVEFYGHRQTAAWLARGRDRTIREIAICAAYCTACALHADCCDGCMLRSVGGCGSVGNLFSRFFDALDEESTA